MRNEGYAGEVYSWKVEFMAKRDESREEVFSEHNNCSLHIIYQIVTSVELCLCKST